jgi:ABC-type glutathione transport system ATPase component
MSTTEVQQVTIEDSPVKAAPLLEVSDVSVSFRANGRTFAALEGINAEVARGETLAVVGESGAGKSTLARAILGLTPVSAGTIRFDGTDITTLNRRARVQLASRLQAVFQNPYSSLNPARPVRSALAEPLVAQRRPRAEIDARIKEMLERVGLSEQAADRYPRQFSGGQRQRIAIARALMVSPDMVICDEALSALDLSVQAQIINLLLELRRDLGLAYLFIGHDLSVVRHIADRVIVLRRGVVVETGTATQVCLQPSDPYTKALMESAPVPDPRVERARLTERASKHDAVR